jgi:hypothetical protein
MYKSFIKEWLIAKHSRVYSVIAETYSKELLTLKPTLFRKWLSKEIDVPEELINLSSLNSALARFRLKENKRDKKIIASSVTNQDLSVQHHSKDFIFSEAIEQKEKTLEL